MNYSDWGTSVNGLASQWLVADHPFSLSLSPWKISLLFSKATPRRRSPTDHLVFIDPTTARCVSHPSSDCRLALSLSFHHQTLFFRDKATARKVFSLLFTDVASLFLLRNQRDQMEALPTQLADTQGRNFLGYSDSAKKRKKLTTRREMYVHHMINISQSQSDVQIIARLTDAVQSYELWRGSRRL